MQAIDITRFSELTGPLTDPRPGDYEVQFRNIQALRGKKRLVFSVVIAIANVAIEAGFFYWLLITPSHYPPFLGGTLAKVATITVIVAIALMEILRLANVVALSRASVMACDPIPVYPQAGLKVALSTTFVPGKEPLPMLEATLRGALQVRYDEGTIDVWCLDEGDTDAVYALCKRLGVNHYSRARRAKNREVTRGAGRLFAFSDNSFLQQETGRFASNKKHGNYNAFIAQILSPLGYDILLAVDTDHVPLPTFAERVLGYFRDPRVAYVVAPQFYGNTARRLTRGADDQQYPFHSLIQRAGNYYRGSMLVGTNFAMRLTALESVKGFSDSVTEDMATGVQLHATRIPGSKKHWQSVYTPDTVAIGEGPSNWSEYFGQQLRWSRGTFELLSGKFWKMAFRLSPGKLLHYSLIMAFYPSMAVGWILGAFNAVLVLGFNVSGLVMAVNLWMALYASATFFQLMLYIVHRDQNVNPFENTDSPGLSGMVMSVLASPMYANSLLATLLRREPKFVTTAKGQDHGSDTLFAFWRHLAWAIPIGSALIVGAVHHTEPFAAFVWPIFQLGICLTPTAWWLMSSLADRRKPIQVHDTASLTETETETDRGMELA